MRRYKDGARASHTLAHTCTCTSSHHVIDSWVLLENISQSGELTSSSSLWARACVCVSVCLSRNWVTKSHCVPFGANKNTGHFDAIQPRWDKVFGHMLEVKKYKRYVDKSINVQSGKCNKKKHAHKSFAAYSECEKNCRKKYLKVKCEKIYTKVLEQFEKVKNKCGQKYHD